MLGDTFDVLVLLGIAVVMSFIGHSRSTRYLRTSLLVGVLATPVWLAFVVAHDTLTVPVLLRAFLRADPLIVLVTIAAAGCGVIVALVVGLLFRDRSG